MLRGMKGRIERWLGLDMPRLEVEGLQITIYGPDPKAVERRKMIVRIATNPMTVGIVSAVAAGLILALFGAA